MKNVYKMSAAGLEDLKKELNYLKTTRSEEVAEMIKVARGFGDLSENSEYDEAKNEQGKLYSRIGELEEIILHAVVIDEGSVPADQVTIGSSVTITAVKTGASRTFKIVGSQEADAMKGSISDASPVGKALMGAKEGQIVTVVAPSGDVQYKVEKIER
ncbi:MAG: transcription elongation factor GreA [Oscillospiraceae bacterium]|nr:transcription elongation factor GreA [Oscillospiraceae bacterium]